MDSKPKIVAMDYKGKWFVLQDADIPDDFADVRPEINLDWVMGEGLKEHVENCLYYGIPAYLGKDKELNHRISAIEEGINRD